MENDIDVVCKVRKGTIMIDFHSHILPGIDDGSRNLEQSIEMLQEEVRQGVHKIIFTPHFYAEYDVVDEYLRKRRHSFEKIQDFSNSYEGELPDFDVGAEVYYFPGMSRAEMLSKLCFCNGNVILIELPFAQWTEEMYREVRYIIEKRRLTVILAHIERYYGYQKDKKVWNKMFDLPLYPQMNAGSFLDRKKCRFCLKFIKEGYEILLGSDCHNTSTRPPNLESGRAVLRKKMGQELLEEIDTLGERVLRGHA